MALALMDEVRVRSLTQTSRLPTYNALERSQRNSSLSSFKASPMLASESTTGLNSTLGQGMITAAIGSQASELVKIQDLQKRFANVSPHRPDQASYQQGKCRRTKSR